MTGFRIAFWILFLCLSFALGAADTEYRIRMLWFPQAEFAGFYVAEADGLYEKAGLRVKIEHPSADEDLFDSLRDGRADAIVSWLSPALERAAGRGEKIVNFCQLSSKTELILIARKSSGVRRPEDLSGRRIGLWIAPALRNPFLVYFEHYGIHDTRVLPILTSVDLFLYGGVDVICGVRHDELYRIVMSGLDLDDLVILPLAEPFPDLADSGLYCRRADYLRSPENFKKMREATMEGWKRAFADPRRALGLVADRCREAGIPFDPAHQRRMLSEMEKIMVMASNTGFLRRASFDETMKLQHFTEKELPFEIFAPGAEKQ